MNFSNDSTSEALAKKMREERHTEAAPASSRIAHAIEVISQNGRAAKHNNERKVTMKKERVRRGRPSKGEKAA